RPCGGRKTVAEAAVASSSNPLHLGLLAFLHDDFMKCNDFSPSNGHSALLHSGSKCAGRSRASHFDAGWSSPVARQAHNLKVVGSNPTPATNKSPATPMRWRGFFLISLLESPCPQRDGKCQLNQGLPCPCLHVSANHPLAMP